MSRDFASSLSRSLLAVALVATQLVTVSCHAADPAPSKVQGLRRLGVADGYYKAGAVTKPKLAMADGAAAIALVTPALPASVLHVSVALQASSPTSLKTSVHCSAVLEANDDALKPISGVVLASDDSWVEVKLSLPKTSGGVLRLGCAQDSDPAPIAVWAQPTLVPLVSEGASPLVVLISLDTLRADHVSGFGSESVKTPELTRLGDEGARFTNTVSESTWTLPSHFSLLYSRMYGFPNHKNNSVGLAKTLSEAGYATAANTGGGFVGYTFRFHLGFDTFSEFKSSDRGKSDLEILPGILKRSLRWIDEHKSVPSFLFLHTYAVHQLPPWEAAAQKTAGPLSQFFPTPAQLEDARAFYADLVRKTDATLASFFEALRDISPTRDVLVIVVSDHGEAFGEHDNFRHGTVGPRITLHDELIRVPLIFWGTKVGKTAAPNPTPVMLADVAPTVLDLLDVPPPASMLGRTLTFALSADQGGESRAGNVAAMSVMPGSWALRTTGHSLIVGTEDQPSQLYDLAKDPQQKTNLAASDPRLVERLSTALRSLQASYDIQAGARSGPPIECPLCGWNDILEFWETVDPTGALHKSVPVEKAIDPATRDRLRALGYVD